MAWTTPGTAVAGDVLTAAFWNEQVRDNLNELNTPSLTMAAGTAAQTGALNADMTYDSASITLTAGKYVLIAGLSFRTSVADNCALGIWNNSASTLVTDSTGTHGVPGTTSSQPLISRPVLVTVSASTVFRPRARRNGSSTITADAAPAGISGSVTGWIVALRVGL